MSRPEKRPHCSEIQDVGLMNFEEDRVNAMFIEVVRTHQELVLLVTDLAARIIKLECWVTDQKERT